MSREVFLMPSAKQILAYENGDISSDEISTVYRFHFLRTYLWIEPSKNGYDIKIRGTMPNINGHIFIANSRIVSSCRDLFSAVTTFSSMVQDIAKQYNIHIKDSLSFGVSLTTDD